MSDSLQTLQRRKTDDPAESPSGASSNPKFSISSLAKALPWSLLVAFVVLIWLLFGDQFKSAREVDLASVVTLRAEAEMASVSHPESSNAPISFEGEPLFQASGWIEPDPLPIHATTLYSGVVESVHVLEGQAVQKGQLLAQMIDEDADLDLQSAQTMLSQAKASLTQREAERALSEATLVKLELEITAAQTRLEELKDVSRRLTSAGGNVFPEGEIVQAKLRVDTQKAMTEATVASREELKAELAMSQGAVAEAEAMVGHAEIQLARAQLAMDRTRIYSPVEGRIQKLYVSPGLKRMLNMDDLESATIAKIYQPEVLQARIDVPLEEAAQLVIGQAVRLRTTLLPNKTFKGQVTRIDGQADLQRNTLQAKVKILDAADPLRPEMLCRAEFLPAGSKSRSIQSTGSTGLRVSLYVPESALLGSGQARTVWALDVSGERLEQREVTVGSEPRDGYLPVLEGLRPGDKVVLEPASDLEAGMRVKTNNPKI